ncbi:hypothetical protein CRI77_04845 [Mycolicibacterium duvalii]|uniref:Uncharacterized protein n=1 Tax=Mycolicibacterium duvalii TaxID=39688 RepID=A0A7I7JZU1_9MYCO|nr:hypothetical protein [Mycolicibacterium duvalii]MCV7367347.1 hypothetical protein [Mycolicibacterium duvalii]PEG43500.1 hypothetical protein CRI77_04845 [Mycolicibacterium duvalii]BBX17283.1 hypothetical protein MDUV_21430 [Mycolicibacterium duvalii]
MLSAIAIVPSAPVMVAELAGAAAAETADLRDAATAAAATLGRRWIAVGAGEGDGGYGPASRGTFAGYGVDLPVALSPAPVGGAPTPLPLCALIAGWLRGVAVPDAEVEAHVLRADQECDAARRHGQALRADLDGHPEPVGVLVVADGANTLTPAAPGGHDPDSISVQAALDDALAAGDTAALLRLPSSIVGRVAYQALAGLAGPGPASVRELYRGAPYGVGYFVGVWTP